MFQSTDFSRGTSIHIVPLHFIRSRMTFKFFEDASLDEDWVDIARKEVGEPESEEEIALKLEELRNLIINKFVDPMEEKALSEENLKRYLRSSNWKPAAALSVFLASAQLVRDFPRFLLPLPTSRETSTECLVWGAPAREKHGSRVVFLSIGPWEPSKISVESFYSYEFWLFQLISIEPRTQVGGVVIVVDLTDFGFKHLRVLGIQELRCLGNFLSGGFPLWFRAIHFVNNPWVFNKLFSLLKPFLSERVISCITFHGHKTSDLVAAVSPDLLPVKLGGTCTEENLEAASANCLSDLEQLEKEVQESRDMLAQVSKMKQKS